MAMVLVKRGLTTQSYVVRTPGAPGDCGAIDDRGGGTPKLTQRPYGPKLNSWPANSPGWSAHNNGKNVRQIFAAADGTSFQAASPELTCGAVWAVYKFGKSNLGGAGTNQARLVSLQSPYGGGSSISIYLNVVTMQIDIKQDHVRFPDQVNVMTAARHKWVAFGIGWQLTQAWNAVNDKWTLKFMYLAPGASVPTTIYTAIDVDFTTNDTMIEAYTGFEWANNGQIFARLGLPALYSMATLSDLVFPADVTMPANATWATPTTEIFYVASSAVGGGDGTTLATAWTVDEARTEMTGVPPGAASGYTVMSGAIVDSSNNQIDTKTIDANVLKQRMVDGTYKSTGSQVYFSDDAGPLRWTTNGGHQLMMSMAMAGTRLSSNPAMGRNVDMRMTQRHTSGWILHSGNVYRKAITSDRGVVFEFDSVAKADIGNEARWLAHPTAANLAAYLAAATAGSFWMDGTTVYLWPTGSGDPNANGKVYEVTISGSVANGDPAGCDFWDMNGEDILVENLNIKMTAAVNNANSYGDAAGGLGRGLMCASPGMAFLRNINLSKVGKHANMLIPARLDSSDGHSRMVFLDSTVNDGSPAAYSGAGGQSVLGEDGTNSGDDGQTYYENVNVTTNAGVVGSTVGIVDVSQATILQHNTGNAALPMSKQWVVNCTMPGHCDFGAVTITSTIQGCTLGTAGEDIYFRAQNNVLTGNTILGRSMYVGNGVAPTAAGVHTIRANKAILSGAVGTIGTIIGIPTITGNIIDATALTGGATKAIWGRGGVQTIVFHGNEVLFNSADAYRLFDTITPASGDSLDMKYNQLQNVPADGTRILVTAYAGANTKTLAQLVSGGQDVGSAWSSDLKLGASYAMTANSPSRNFVPVASVPSLAGTADFNGKLRPASGFTDAGAVQYISLASSFVRTRPGRSPRIVRV